MDAIYRLTNTYYLGWDVVIKLKHYIIVKLCFSNFVTMRVRARNFMGHLLVHNRWLNPPPPPPPAFAKSYILYKTSFEPTFTIVTAPNTMICCTVYTKRVRKNNTSTYTNLSLKHCIVKCALYQHYAVFEY